MARTGGKINKTSPSYINSKASADKALKDVANNLQSVIDGLKIQSEDVLYEVGLNILNTSNRYAPLDEGELRDSSYIEDERTETGYTVEVGYTADHAVYTHELGPYKNPTTPGTGFKYLQRAVTETESDIEQILADAFRNILK